MATGRIAVLFESWLGGPFVGSESAVTVQAGVWEWKGIKKMETEALAMFI